MSREVRENKPKKVVFNAEIDGAINGFAIGFLFIGIGLFLLIRPGYFFAPIASYIVGAIIGLVGVAGTGIELTKATRIKGVDNFSFGAVFFVGWLVQYFYIGKLWSNIVFFAALILGGYGLLLGVFQAIYSIIYNAKNHKKANDTNEETISMGKLFSQIVLFLTQLLGLAVAILNVLKASGL